MKLHENHCNNLLSDLVWCNFMNDYFYYERIKVKFLASISHLKILSQRLL